MDVEMWLISLDKRRWMNGWGDFDNLARCMTMNFQGQGVMCVLSLHKIKAWQKVCPGHVPST